MFDQAKSLSYYRSVLVIEIIKYLSVITYRGVTMSKKKNQVSRRQFLNYSLTGLGGFMAAGILIPNLRFAIDPVLKTAGESGDLTNVSLSVDDITNEPQRVDWEVEQVDGWYESDVKQTAWVYKDDDGEIQA